MQVKVFKFGCLLIGIAVGLGAFGAHGWKEILTANDSLETFKTGILYHFIHGLAIVLTSLSPFHNEKSIKAISIIFFSGILLFSGSLYFLSLFAWSWLGPITPIGGLSFLAGWSILILNSKDGTL